MHPIFTNSLRCVLVMAPFWLAGCGAPETADSGGSTVELTAAGTTFPNTAGEQHWQRFGTQARELSNGLIEPKLLIYGQLGSEEQIVSGLRRGRVQFANLSAMAVSTLVPEAALLYTPFLFESDAEADYIFDRYLTDVYRELLAAKGLYLLSWYEIGFLQVYAKQPLLVPADAQGRRFRVGASLSAREFAQALGADVIPLGFADVVASLQTGLIEAGENSVSLYARTGIAGEAPYLTLTDHAYGVSLIVVQKAWWDKQAPAVRVALSEAFPAAVETREDVRAESTQDLSAARELGITVHEPSPAQREAWRDVSLPLQEQLAGEIGGRSAEIMGLIRQGQQEFRTQ